MRSHRAGVEDPSTPSEGNTGFDLRYEPVESTGFKQPLMSSIAEREEVERGEETDPDDVSLPSVENNEADQRSHMNERGSLEQATVRYVDQRGEEHQVNAGTVQQPLSSLQSGSASSDLHAQNYYYTTQPLNLHRPQPQPQLQSQQQSILPPLPELKPLPRIQHRSHQIQAQAQVQAQAQAQREPTESHITDNNNYNDNNHHHHPHHPPHDHHVSSRRDRRVSKPYLYRNHYHHHHHPEQAHHPRQKNDPDAFAQQRRYSERRYMKRELTQMTQRYVALKDEYDRLVTYSDMYRRVLDDVFVLVFDACLRNNRY
uniref:Uncharacterized protein n=1 Tax=Penaeus monodon majanivirus A TaxID=2984271 RepID=A0A9C7BYB3_9VIRU|nr:MAG: hypothetical protein [Penaeus monodon majanivirus A]